MYKRRDGLGLNLELGNELGHDIYINSRDQGENLIYEKLIKINKKVNLWKANYRNKNVCLNFLKYFTII